MEIRRATALDIDEIAKLYRDTILKINAKDYTPEQINVWAATYSNQAGWARRMEEQHFYVAVSENKIAGFASIDNAGYFDLLYVHKDCQKQGIATNLCVEIEKAAKEIGVNEITVQSSITAKTFFEKLGFTAVSEKHKLVNNVPFTNTIMAKKI